MKERKRKSRIESMKGTEKERKRERTDHKKCVTNV